MSSLAGSTKHWLLPPGLAAGLQTLRARLALGAGDRRRLQANAALRGRHAGERLFILCSGPSIKTQDLAPLQGRLCLGVANFFVHPDYAKINPRYHCIAPLHPPFTDADGLRWFREMATPLAGRELFLGLSDRRLVESASVFPATQVHYLAFGAAWPARPPAGLPLDRLLPAPQSVSIMALLAALELGASEIYLVGADHTAVDFQHGGYSYTHFYTGRRPNQLGELATPKDLEPEFAAYVSLWRQYKVLRAIAEQRGVRIYNATAGGLLDVFPRVTLAAALA